MGQAYTGGIPKRPEVVASAAASGIEIRVLEAGRGRIHGLGRLSSALDPPRAPDGDLVESQHGHSETDLADDIGRGHDRREDEYGDDGVTTLLAEGLRRND